jgi:membrane protein CcdC involved in cytochrome C biogenesis
MEKLLEKLSSYNIFNYLFPGMIFCILLEKTTSYSIIQENIVIDVFLAYFIGLLISRISSLIIEPLLKKVKFVKFAEYKDFLVALYRDGVLKEVDYNVEKENRR